MPYERMVCCIETLKQWGYTIVEGKTIHTQFHYFSADDEERKNDLQCMLDAENIQAIFCARGGYGLSRIIDKLDFKHFIKNPKWIIGYSDITVLLSHIYTRFGIASIHAPMAAAFNNDGFKK